MPTFTGGFVRPGVYVKENFISQAGGTPGYFVPVLVGIGQASAGYDVRLMDALSETTNAEAVYGAWSNETAEQVFGSNIKNSITLGEQILKANEVTSYYAVALDPADGDLTTEAGLKAAFDKALNKLLFFGDNSPMYIIIPLFPMSMTVNKTSMDTLKSHIDFSRSITEQKGRIAIIGNKADSDSELNAEQQYIDVAEYLKSYSFAYVAPSTAVIPTETGDINVGGEYLAAGVGAIIGNPAYDPATPISGKMVKGFKSIKDVFTKTLKNAMGAAGVLMIDTVDSNGEILMDLSTDQSMVVKSQIKFTKVADYTAKLLRVNLKQMYINTKFLGSSTLSNIKLSITTMLSQLIANEIINNYQIVSVGQNAMDPRQIDINIAIQPVPDVSWIYIVLNVTL
jgi:hypothetical protein